jgi:hypothetical protein
LILHGSSVLLYLWGITHLQWRLTSPFLGQLKKIKRIQQELQTDMEVEADAVADSDDKDDGKGALETDGSWSQKSYQVGAKHPMVAVKMLDEKNWECLLRTIHYNMCGQVKAKSSLLPFHTLLEL